jgi:hypothetical protein
MGQRRVRCKRQRSRGIHNLEINLSPAYVPCDHEWLQAGSYIALLQVDYGLLLLRLRLPPPTSSLLLQPKLRQATEFGKMATQILYARIF